MPPRAPRARACADEQFGTADGELVVGGKRLSQLAARVGQTPFYAYDRGLLRARVANCALPCPLRSSCTTR
jgi:diaminopimelate decarboxylase